MRLCGSIGNVSSIKKKKLALKLFSLSFSISMGTKMAKVTVGS